MACSASSFLFPVLRKGHRQGGWAQGMGRKVGVEERGQPQDSCGEWLREVGLGRWEQTARVGLGVPQSLQDYSGAEIAGAIRVAHSWLQWEEAVGRQTVCLSINSFQQAELVVHQWAGGSEQPITRSITSRRQEC